MGYDAGDGLEFQGLTTLDTNREPRIGFSSEDLEPHGSGSHGLVFILSLAGSMVRQPGRHLLTRWFRHLQGYGSQGLALLFLHQRTSHGLALRSTNSVFNDSDEQQREDVPGWQLSRS